MMGDIISRREAIDSIMEEPPEARYPVFYAEKIRQLPSAQPEIIRCKDCKHYNSEKPGMVYCPNLDCWVSESFFCKDGERSVEDGSAIIPSSRTDKPDHT